MWEFWNFEIRQYCTTLTKFQTYQNNKACISLILVNYLYIYKNVLHIALCISLIMTACLLKFSKKAFPNEAKPKENFFLFLL